MSPSRGSRAVHRMLENTISACEVDAIFQPIVDLRSGCICGYEALSRPSRQSPFKNIGEIFDSAEQTGMLWGLEMVTRRQSLDAAAHWPGDVQLFLNTTPQVFSDTRFAATLIQCVRSVPGLTASRIVLEITERADQQFMEGLDEQVRLVKEAGFQVAIDDVGAGTSGLQRIVALRPHWLKLDRDLISDIHVDRVKQHLVRFFLHFARLSGVRMIAEGIERREELEVLTQLGVVYGQGYLLGRPGSRDQSIDPDLAEWMRQTWGGSDRDHLETPRHARIARFARPTLPVDSRDIVREVAATLLRQSSVPGVAVMEGRRFAGWCDREQVLRAAGDTRSTHPIGHIVNSDVTTVGIDTSIVDALQLAATRDERSLATPLMLTDHGQIQGMLTVRDLLNAAADMATQVNARTSPLTGLPNLVRADKHLCELIRQREESIRSGVIPHGVDAAVIDIRSFARYNSEFGYELGDELIKRLAMMIHMLVSRGDAGVFTSHLRDDQFLVTARPGILGKRTQHLRRQFDRLVAGDGGEGLDPGIRLRVLLIEDAISKVSSARTFHELARELRLRGDSDSDCDDPMAGAFRSRLSA
ncbi:MAG: EAL domain-containing protein [Phycisphaeraceae bacterium]|nr:EAL domain-containing protein [Phycisphaerae bacterium]MBX3392772.1 EAL domain-containing protein [Phycisphaeraceae bacterium]HRJ49905.1 EAL domain-containing protein [Phycisphaerales bacterium]